MSVSGLKKKLLVVDDDRDIVHMLKYNFQKEGYRVLSAKNAEAALPLVHRSRPDMIILDVSLPDMDGWEFCRTVRQDNPVPIVFLTGKKNELDRVLGLKMGADDYVTKPFFISELLARVQAVLRRSALRPSARDSKEPVTVGGIQVDFDRHEIRVNGKPVDLPPKEFELLKLLIKADGKVLSRDHLLEQIWGYERSSEIDTRTVDQHIARLRRKLQSEKQRIVTVANFGYQIRRG